MNFKGGHAHLTGFTVGHFTVKEIAGRDRRKAPIWLVVCRACNRASVFGHTTLTNRLESHCEGTLLCGNPLCVRSRPDTIRTETLADIRKAERQEREQAQAAARYEQERVARQTAQDAAIRAEKCR